MDKKFELIVTIVKRGQSDKVVKASREAGATGGTIIYGRGTNLHDDDSIFGMKIQPEKEIIITLVEQNEKEKIMNKICKDAGLDNGKDGIIFTLPVNDIVGTRKFMQLKKENEKKEV